MKRARTAAVERQATLGFDAAVLRPFTGEEARGFSRALADSSPPKLRHAIAQSFCRRVVEAYWSKLHSRHGRTLRAAPGEGRHLKTDAVDAAVALGEAAAELPTDEASYTIGSAYAAMLPPDMRAEGGVYYTPSAVVRRLLDLVEDDVDWKTCRVLDPACGGGAFVAPASARIIDALKAHGCKRSVILRSLGGRLRGQEIDPFAAWMSQVFFESTCHLALNGAGDDLPEIVTVRDSLQHADEEGFDLVIGNPPYGRIGLSPEQRAMYQRSLYGHANMYAVFLDLALRKTRQGGTVAYVTPTSFLSGEYYKRLRGLLVREAPPQSFDFISERAGVFDDVLQETMLTVFRRGAAAKAAAVSFLEVDADAVKTRAVTQVSVPPDDSPWVMPRSPSFVPVAKALAKMTDRLASWGYGVSTGPLVWNRHKAQLRDDVTKKSIPLIWAESVTADGRFEFRAARRNHSPYFEPIEGDDWLVVRKPCVLLQRTTSKEQPRRLIVAELPQSFLDDHPAVTIENHLNMIVPIVPTPLVSTKVLAAFLNSRPADQVFRCISGSVAVSAYELESMPLPTPTDTSRLGDVLARRHTRHEIDECCERLYGLR